MLSGLECYGKSYAECPDIRVRVPVIHGIGFEVDSFIRGDDERIVLIQVDPHVRQPFLLRDSVAQSDVPAADEPCLRGEVVSYAPLRLVLEITGIGAVQVVMAELVRYGHRIVPVQSQPRHIHCPDLLVRTVVQQSELAVEIDIKVEVLVQDSSHSRLCLSVSPVLPRLPASTGLLRQAV